MRRDDGCALQQGPRFGAQPRRASEHRVTHRRWDLRAAGREHLRDEERIAVGRKVESRRIYGRGLGEPRDGRLRQWSHREAVNRTAGREFSEDDAQRV